MLPIYKMILTNETEGMDYIALVEHPAHMKAFEYFNGKDEKIKYHFNEEKRIVMGVAIAVDLPIYRRDEQFGEHYVVFSKKDTEEIWEKMMASNYMHNVNEMHDSNRKITDISYLHSFAIDRSKGINPPKSFEGQNLKDGSIIVSYKVNNDKVWNDIKNGKHLGFSIEGWFDKRYIKTKQQTQMKKENKKSLFELVFGKTKEQFGTATTVDGVQVVWTGELEEGTELRISTEEGEVLAYEGVFSIDNDGEITTVTVDGNGLIVSVKQGEIEEVRDEDIAIEEAMSAEEIAQVIAEIQSMFDSQIKELKEKNETFEKQIATLVTELDKNEKRKFTTKTSNADWKTLINKK